MLLAAGNDPAGLSAFFNILKDGGGSDGRAPRVQMEPSVGGLLVAEAPPTTRGRTLDGVTGDVADLKVWRATLLKFRLGPRGADPGGRAAA